MYSTIYIGEKPIILIEQGDPSFEHYRHDPNIIFFDEISSKVVHSTLHEIKRDSIIKVVIYQPDLRALQHSFFKHFTLVQAAGGLVENDEGKVLIIFRRGKWDLPKGKLDEGETPALCAIREVEEETGLRNITLLSPICETFHIYEEFGKSILKQTFWYSMSVDGPQTLLPQTEEDIELVRWIQKSEWSGFAADSYASIREVFSYLL
jgi:8-oxo-dGTP pyrophosphatase MutT (NUDIX family)